VAFQKHLFDTPDEHRKVHGQTIPNFGGVAIFAAFLFSCALFMPPIVLPEANTLLAAAVILFMTGLKDDLVGLDPLTKFLAQFAAAFIVALPADLRITNLEGVFGINELPYYASVLVTVIFIVGVVNAFNLIDGIDGLCGTLGIIFSTVFAFAFFKSAEPGWAYMGLALTGALIGFLFYNITPAKIFMGDSGSLMLGYVAAIFSIKFLDIRSDAQVMAGPFQISLGICLVTAVLIVPIFDTIRVFTLRILKNTSPFVGDRNHLHHRLLFVGLTHIQATLVLALLTLFFISMALLLQDLSPAALLLLLVGTALAINGLFSLYVERHKKRNFAALSRHNAGSADEPGEELAPAGPGFGHVLKNVSKN
jgi:UDP-N-acetylmuramyl pentapeptide phosphotransferase/UDP-N-acetylglucosamine-1-phosphate transferase